MRCNVKFKKGKLICCFSISHCKQTMLCRQWRFGPKQQKTNTKKNKKTTKNKNSDNPFNFLTESILT